MALSINQERVSLVKKLFVHVGFLTDSFCRSVQSPRVFKRSLASDMKVRRVASEADLPAIADEWGLLEERNYLRTIWLTYDWFYHWSKCRGTPDNLFVLAVQDNGRLLGVSPLIRSSITKFGHSLRQLGFACEDIASEFILAPERTEDCIDAVVDYLIEHRSEWDVLRLKKIRADSPVTDLLRRVVSRKGVPFAQDTDAASPYISVQGSWADYDQTLSRKFRQNMRRALATLEQFGEVSVLKYPQSGSYEETLRAVFDIADASWQATKGTAVSSSQTDRTFFESFSRVAAERDWLDIRLLAIAGKPVAFEYNIRYLHTLNAFKCGYDPKYFAGSPGTYLRYLSTRDFFSSGIKEIDLMGSSYFFTTRWSSTSRLHLELLIYNLSRRTLLPYFYDVHILPRLRKCDWIRKLRLHMGRRMK